MNLTYVYWDANGKQKHSPNFTDKMSYLKWFLKHNPSMTRDDEKRKEREAKGKTRSFWSFK